MGIFGGSFSQILSDMSQPGVGTPAKAPGKQTLTAALPPRTNTAGLSDPAREFVEHGDRGGGLWDDSPESEAKRARLREVIALYMPMFFGDLDAAIERVILDVTLSKAPESMALAIIGFACDVISSGLISKLNSAMKAAGTAARVAKGVSEATEQAVPAMASAILKVPPKQLETAAKTLIGVVKKRVEGRVRGMASRDFDSAKSDKKAFLKGIQNGFRDMEREFSDVYLGGSDEEKMALAVMLENRPSLAELESQFRDLVSRYERQDIANIGKVEGIGDAMHKVVCVTAYGQRIYLHVLTASGNKVGAPLRMTGGGGQNKDYIDPDDPARLVSIISPDLVSTAIENNGGKVEEVPVTWEAYRDGNWSPVPTLSMSEGAGWPATDQGRFKLWLMQAYRSAHGGHEPPDDAFSWGKTFGGAKQSPPAPPTPQAGGDVADTVASAADDAFNLF